MRSKSSGRGVVRSGWGIVVASNRSIDNCLSNFQRENKLEKLASITLLDESFQPCHPPLK